MSAVTSIFQGVGFSKIYQLQINNKNLVLPTYFPAISSAEARFMLEPLLKAIIAAGYPRLLISAYDLALLSSNRHKSVNRILTDYAKNNFIFLDSGTFESYWFNDKKWSFSNYKNEITKINSDLYTSFDTVPSIEQSYESVKKDTITNIKKSNNLRKNNLCLYVCHGQNTRDLIKLVKYVIDSNFKPEFIAIPERDCGKTIEDKIVTIQKIRKILDQHNSKIILHLLGLGNPLTMTLLTFSGANSFDSVDWSRWIIDRKTLQFTDFSNLSLLDCSCKACTTSGIEYSVKAIFHNLLFYQDFISELQEVIIRKEEIQFLKDHFDKKSFSRIVKFFNS